jgi:hypothetical protein
MVVLAAALLVVALAMAALVADAGLVLAGRGDMAMAADLAAISAAQELPDRTAAARVALDLIDMNAGRFLYAAPTRTVSFPSPGVVRVEAGMDLPSAFLRILGTDSLRVGAVAEAARLDPDVALIIDRSGSMCRASHGSVVVCPADGTPWEPFRTVQATAKDFVREIPGDPTFALISYATTPRLDLAPTTNRALVQAAIDNLTPGGYTDIAGSVFLAIDQILLALGSNPKLIVLLTDGVSNRVDGAAVSEQTASQALLDAASYALSRGIVIYGINYGSAQYVNNDLMRQVAESTDGTFYHAPDTTSLAEVYRDIAERAHVRLTYVD